MMVLVVLVLYRAGREKVVEVSATLDELTELLAVEARCGTVRCRSFLLVSLKSAEPFLTFCCRCGSGRCRDRSRSQSQRFGVFVFVGGSCRTRCRTTAPTCQRCRCRCRYGGSG